MCPRLLAAALLIVLSSCGAAPSVSPASPPRLSRVPRDSSLIVEETESRDGRRYIGGTAFSILSASPDTVALLLEDPKALWQVLPRLVSMEVRERDAAERSIALEHGFGLFRGGYTVRMVQRRVPWAGGWVLRFALDKRFEHDVVDAFGRFELHPYGEGATLVIYQVRIALDAGVLRLFFEERLRRAALSVADRLRRYVARQKH
jgi:carbon monoxide dehydrogenase subunit G